MICTYGSTLLKVEDVSLSFAEKNVLSHVDIQIQQAIDPTGAVHGQVVGFLGPSGIGKTSLFRIIAGLDEPTSGRVVLNGFDRPVKAGEVGVVAQSYPLFNHRKVNDNLLLAARKKEQDEKTAQAKVDEYLAKFNISNTKHQYPAMLSGGQRQRVAIIQQILCSEHFLLMDEPFSGLDMISLEEVSRTIKEVAALDGLNTIIVVTHDITSASAVSDHLWLMGRDRTPAGEAIPGARIMEVYDLIQRDLAWHPEVVTQPAFTEFVREVKERFRTL